jgi:hypothetical protein
VLDYLEDPMAVEVNLDSLLDKDYESKSFAELLKAPVSALAGVSDGDAQHLKDAFNIKTIADLGKNKFFRAAMLITELSENGAK